MPDPRRSGTRPSGSPPWAWAVLLALLGVAGACLNPRPDDFPSIEPEEAGGSSNDPSGNTSLGEDVPAAQTCDDNPLLALCAAPDANAEPTSPDPPDAVDNDPADLMGAGADAGAEEDAGSGSPEPLAPEAGSSDANAGPPDAGP